MVVKSWDLVQLIAMGADQRNAIRRALNEDADKLIQEGDPNDPQLRRLRREIDEVNRLFDEFERRANANLQDRWNPMTRAADPAIQWDKVEKRRRRYGVSEECGGEAQTTHG